MRPWLVAAVLTTGLVAAGVAGGQRWMSLSLPPVPSPSRNDAPATCPDGAQTIHADWIGRPAWSATVAAVDLIVVAKRLAGGLDVEDRGHCLFVSNYAFTVLQVIKGQVGIGDRLKVGWMGRPIDVVNDQPHPEPDEVLVLFLRAHGGNHYPAYGPGGILRVVEGIVTPYSVTYGLSGVVGRPVDGFLSSLRELAEAR